MQIFNALYKKLETSLSSKNGHVYLRGVNSEQWTFLFQQLLSEKNSYLQKKSHLFLCHDSETAEKIYSILIHGTSYLDVFYFPSEEISPYNDFLSSERTLFQQFLQLKKISETKNSLLIVTTINALAQKIPPKQFFEDHTLSLKTTDIFSPYDLAKHLSSWGYSHSASVEEPGTFSQKGEIFDIFPLEGGPYRLSYFDEMIEEIHPIDPSSLKTIRDRPLEEITLFPTPQIFSQPSFVKNFRENIPIPSPQFKKKFEKRKEILSTLSSGILFPNYPLYAPLFFKETETLFDYLPKEIFVSKIENEKIEFNFIEKNEQLRLQYSELSQDKESSCIMPSPAFFFDQKIYEKLENFPGTKTCEVEAIRNLQEDPLEQRVDMILESTTSFFNHAVNPTLKKYEYIRSSFNYLKKEFAYSGEILFSTTTENARKEILYLLEEMEFSEEILGRIHFLKNNISSGFYYKALKTILITEGDLFSVKTKKIRRVQKSNQDLFAEQISTLSAGDFVMHAESGLGEYLGMESLSINGIPTDFLVIEYDHNDKVYVPVYKMNLIQKHADASSHLKKDSLRTLKFKNLREKAKISAKKLAFDLLRLQAERQSSKAFAFSPPDHLYKEFELAFPFQETPDQLMAIDQVLESMQRPLPMDHLICGDVGFGKTEIAIRASFKAVCDRKQVAILVPTTILTLQHYHTFSKRLKDFAVNIEFLSRFKSTKETKEIKEKLKNGQIDIIIGTHKLLSKDISFSDLGLVIVDEEQRFGVTHKEKLKLLKSSLDFLTLTATPIPRTLQMAFLGLRDLSLIQTAPPSRQSIRSYIVKEDAKTIQEAVRKEIQRGGQVFIVHNKVKGIEAYANGIRELVPEAKIIIAHGQMNEKDLEERMKDFYLGKYNILISTTIIESGLDVPNANTMIIERADHFGLSQLHQLRGRIGRSDKKAYCYFVIPALTKLTPLAEKRLKALQTYTDIGSGFHIASSDLEIRGAGDILGGEQSGHIENIGLELYMELLKEAVSELKGEKQLLKTDIEFVTPFATLIPHTYISDSSERLKFYKKLANATSLGEVEEIQEILYDIYGSFPQFLHNLFSIIKSKIYLKGLAIKSVQVSGKNISIQFEKSLLEQNPELRNSIVDYFLKKPKQYFLSPTYKVTYSSDQEILSEALEEFSKTFHEKIFPA